MDKFTSDCPQPNPLENEVLAIMSEEAAEIIDELVQLELMRLLAAIQKRCSKTQRFGIEEIQTGQEFTNRQRLSIEIGQFYAVVNKAASLGLISKEHFEQGLEEKEPKLEKYLQNKG